MTDSLFFHSPEFFDAAGTLSPPDLFADLSAQVSQGSASLDPSLSGSIDMSLSGSFSTIIDASPAAPDPSSSSPSPPPPQLVPSTLTATAVPVAAPARPVMATFPRVSAQAPPVMATFPPLPPSSSNSSSSSSSSSNSSNNNNSGVTRPRDEPQNSNGNNNGNSNNSKTTGGETKEKPDGEQQKEQQEKKEKELEPWMETNPLLQWLSSPNRATRNLVHWDAARWRRRRPGAQRWLVDRMGLVERYDMVAQVVCAMDDAEGVWACTARRRPRADELHWPRLCDLERSDDGAVLVRPETLVGPAPRPCGSFAALMHDVLGKRGVSEPRDPGEAFGYLFNYAAADFGADDTAVREWRNDVGTTMTAPLAEVCRAFDRERDVPPECTRAVLGLLTEGNSNSSNGNGNGTVTLLGFCRSTRVFGHWWEGRMLAGLRELCAMESCFYIATTRDAEERLRDTPQLRYIVRPRCKPDRGDDALWPFALTMRVWPTGTIEHYVVSFAHGEFFVRDTDGTVMRRPSLKDLVTEFARSKCFR